MFSFILRLAILSFCNYYLVTFYEGIHIFALHLPFFWRLAYFGLFLFVTCPFLWRMAYLTPPTLRAESFAGRNFREFREFWPFSRKFLPLDKVIGENRESFSREILLKI